MGRSMWSCSGQHWLRAAAVWMAFAFFFAIAVELSSEANAETISSSPAPIAQTQQTELQQQPPSSIVIKVSALDLAQLDATAFGDHE